MRASAALIVFLAWFERHVNLEVFLARASAALSTIPALFARQTIMGAILAWPLGRAPKLRFATLLLCRFEKDQRVDNSSGCSGLDTHHSVYICTYAMSRLDRFTRHTSQDAVPKRFSGWAGRCPDPDVFRLLLVGVRSRKWYHPIPHS